MRNGVGGGSPINGSPTLVHHYVSLSAGSDFIAGALALHYVPLPSGSDSIAGTGVPHFVPKKEKAVLFFFTFFY